MRFIITIALTLLFVFWILYRCLIKKDLRKNINNLMAGLFFIAVWIIIYLTLFFEKS
jgi:hypothetical protein